MTASAKKTYGTLVKIGGTTIAKVITVGDVGPEADTLDITSLDSPNNAMEKMAGLIDSGQVQLGLNFLPGNANQQSLRVLVGANPDPLTTFSIVWTDVGETWSFKALVKSFKAKGEVKSKLDATVVLDISDIITVT